MRIAQVAPLAYPIPPQGYGGIESFLDVLIRGMIKRGHEVTLFGTGDSGIPIKIHAVVDRCLTEQFKLGLVSQRHTHYHNGLMAEVLSRAGDFDIIHCHIGCEYIPCSQLVSTPVIFTLHDELRADDLWTLSRYRDSIIVGISSDQVLVLNSSDRKRARIIHHGCEFREEYAPGEHREGNYLLFLGRMAPEKNPIDAIHIARKANCRLILAGGPRPRFESEQDYFKREVLPLVDGEQIIYAGQVDLDHKRDLLYRASALLFPIRWREPFGLVMIEAMEAGVPVLAYPSGSVVEVVDEGVTGFVASDVNGLATLVAAASRLDRNRVRSHAATRFSAERMIAEYEALYNESTKRSGGA